MEKKGLVLVLGTALISGFAIFLNKFGVSVINPYIFTGLKNIIVAVLVVSWLLMMKDWRILWNLGRKKWLMLVLVGLIGGSIPFLLFFKGLSMTGGAQAAYIHKTMFVYVAVLASIFLKEKIDKRFVAGGLLLLFGNFFVLNLIPHQPGWGDLLVLIATIFWASENVLSKHLLRELPSRIIIWGRMFFGSTLIVLFWILTGQAHLVTSLSLEQIGWVLITSILLFGYVATWYSGLRYIKVSTAAAVLTLASPITTLLSFSFLGLSITFQQWLGIFLIVIGCVGLVLNRAPSFRHSPQI
jgi:drug/metabolite transporter (DMT)-like permease